MNNFFINLLKELAQIDNTFIFVVSIIPYSIFLFYLNKINIINITIKTGFALTLLFVLVTIIFSILSLNLYNKTLVEIDIFHGFAEAFLTLSDFVIFLGFINLLKKIEIKNS
tara:strand:- start:1283 stop:1618 length:336 start_codon:yes stop_codon:yes gene_type:complete